MAMIICSECSKEFSDKAPACPNCGCPIEFAKANNTTTDSSRKLLLREYLEKIRLLETDIYTMDAMCNRLKSMSRSYPQKRSISEPTLPIPTSPYLWPMEDEVTVDYVVKRIMRGNNILRNPMSTLLSPLRALNADQIAEEENRSIRNRNQERKEKNERMLKKYHEAMADYERIQFEYKEAVLAEETKHKTACFEADRYNQGLEAQIKTNRMQISETKVILDKLYNIGIIYPKYRNIVAITTFCEYMDSGRRTELEGTHGMYDLYEAELLGQKIVGEISKVTEAVQYVSYQLSGISSQLSGIARNQVMLHEEIARGNAISAKICADTGELLEQSAAMLAATGKLNDELKSLHHTAQILESNTAATAYNAEVAARRVDAIAKIEEYEYALRHPSFPSP